MGRLPGSSSSPAGGDMTLNIGFVVASDVLGGHEFQAAQLAGLLGRFHSVTVLLNSEHFRPVFEDRGLSTRVCSGLFFSPGHIGRQLLNGLTRRRVIASVLDGFDHVVISAGAVEAGLTVGVAMLGRRRADLYLPFLYERSVLWGWPGELYTVLLKGALYAFSRIITINRIQARLMGRCHRDRVVVVENHVVACAELPDRGIPPRLVYIGRFDTQKRIVALIKALDHPGNPFCELLLIGDGPLRSQVQAAADKASVLKVRCLGWKDRVQQLQVLQRSDILVLNSSIEGEPMVLREAIAAGMVAVAHDIPGVRGVTHRQLRFASHAQLRAILTQIHDDPQWGRDRILANRAAAHRERQIGKLFECPGMERL
jgi:glycosyltransferase involved in cell wall biosynthesis